MRPDDDALCWLCDRPLGPDRAAASWHGFGAHRECARSEEAREADAAAPEPTV